MTTIELPSDTSEITAEIYQRTDGTYGYSVRDGGLSKIVIGDWERKTSFDSLQECEDAAKDQIQSERQSKAQEIAAREDRAKWVTVKTVR